MLSLKEIKDILQKYNIRPKKRLGQNFLIDQNIQKKIIDTVKVTKDDVVIEIGPGLGALTGGLCERAKKVIAIEKDKKLHRFLVENGLFSNLELIHGDILEYNWCQALNGHLVRGTSKVVGNLPYYLSSPILVRLIENRSVIDTAYITLQKEFANRLLAEPGSKDYGSITCFTQFYAEPEILFDVKKTMFYPKPKVDSCFLKLRMREKPIFATDEDKLFEIIRTGFSKRRKTILNCLYLSGKFGSKSSIFEALKTADISHVRRPETISLEEFVRMTTQL